MTVAATASRRRKQMRQDKRYAGTRATISRKLQGRSKSLALTALITRRQEPK